MSHTTARAATRATAGDGRQRPARRGRPPKVDGSGRDKILDAAEELFSKHGLHGVTIQEVATRARVDAALLHYYFGNKRGLFDAVFGRRAAILNQRRMESLDRYEREAGSTATVEGLLDAFIRPLFDSALQSGPGWRNYFALVALVNNAPEWGGATMTKYFDPVIHRFIAALRKLLPGAAAEDVYWCYQLLTGSITLALSQTGRIDRLSQGICKSTDLQAVLARMLPYAASGFMSVCGAAGPARRRAARKRSTPTKQR